jgi:ATP-binding cassette subfamily B protein
MFASGIITIVGDLFLLVGIISVMLWMNVKLSLVTFSILPLLFFIAWFFRRRMRQSFREVRAGLGRLNSYLTECIGGMTLIQAFNRQNDEEQRFRKFNTAYRDSNIPVIFWDASLYAIVEALSSVAVALLLWYGGGEILRGALTFGVLVAFIQYIEKFFGPIRDLSAKYSVMQGAMAALERIFALQDVAEEQGTSTAVGTGSSRNTLDFPPPFQGDGVIEFRNVSFAYQSGEKALEDFTLVVNRGERVALVGESGGGKTTITRLLTRLYEIDAGVILIDGVDIREIPREELRKRVGVVLQDPCIFSGSIEFNISLGDEAARTRVHGAAATVGAARFIEERPKGYDEQARERGSNFSVGEKQLISFARAVAFNPEILVLDEATASVDSASEQMIQEGIRALMQGRTSLVIAHRLSTIRDANRIVVVHHGKKMEEGTHQELMEQRGYYFRLHQLQFA